MPKPLGGHFVQFYEEDAPLMDGVCAFLHDGMRGGEAALLVATPEHRAGIEERLQAKFAGAGGAASVRGELIALDAKETLALFMVDGWPDEERFLATVGATLERATRGGGRPIRAFGEMVALLWRQNLRAAAIRLEELWTQLERQVPLTLFCAYPLDLFASSADDAAFERVCAQHTHVVPSGRALEDAASAQHDHTVAQLQQKAAALEVEVERRTQAEQALRRREKELADFLENSAEGLNRIELDGTVSWANRAQLELLRLDFDDYVGHPAAQFHADPEQGHAFVARLREGLPLFNQPAALRAGDGSVRHVMIHSTPVFGDDGSLQCSRCFTRDVTDELSARDAQKRAHEDRTRLLERAEAASRAKDEFLAMLGHELRNPLAPIVTALQLMKMRGDTQTTKEQAIIGRQVDHLIRLVDDLLDISKVTRGKVELRKEWVEIGDVMAKAVEMARMLLEQRQHRLLMHVPSNGLRWLGDPVRLAQVVANLLTNAARYTPTGGEVRLTAFRDTGHVVISVQDNGMGMEPPMLTRVFDLFVQGQRGVDRAEGGLGIGLALVKSLVAMHGGTVFAKSEGRGRGSEFVVRLPLAQVGAHETPPASPVLRGPRTDRPKRVLVVDDNADAADTLGLTLRAHGHEVMVVYDPIAALRSAGAFKPEVAVLDIGLPVIDGYELAGRLLELLGRSSCRLFALTGYGRDADQQRSRQAGFAAHLVKPVNLPQLLALVADEADMPSRG